MSFWVLRGSIMTQPTGSKPQCRAITLIFTGKSAMRSLHSPRSSWMLFDVAYGCRIAKSIVASLSDTSLSNHVLTLNLFTDAISVTGYFIPRHFIRWHNFGVEIFKPTLGYFICLDTCPVTHTCACIQRSALKD